MTKATAKKPSQTDWDPIDVKYALHKRGITLAGLAEAHGLTSSSSLSATFTRPMPANEKRIADAIGVHPKVIWPSRYNADGSRKLQGFRKLQFNAASVARNIKASDMTESGGHRTGERRDGERRKVA
jgi:lambda repressor-like predicted transcriptional regulator